MFGYLSKVHIEAGFSELELEIKDFNSKVTHRKGLQIGVITFQVEEMKFLMTSLKEKGRFTVLWFYSIEDLFEYKEDQFWSIVDSYEYFESPNRNAQNLRFGKLYAWLF